MTATEVLLVNAIVTWNNVDIRVPLAAVECETDGEFSHKLILEMRV